MMQAAIIQLEIALDIMLTNAPINIQEGNLDQAVLELKNAQSYRAAIEVLQSVN